MMQSNFGDGLIALGLWVAMSVVTLVLGGLIAWTVVTIHGRRESRRREPLRPWCSGWTDGTVEPSRSAGPPADRSQPDRPSKSPLRRSVDRGSADGTRPILRMDPRSRCVVTARVTSAGLEYPVRAPVLVSDA
jgi:hypothetical protein